MCDKPVFLRRQVVAFVVARLLCVVFGDGNISETFEVVENRLHAEGRSSHLRRVGHVGSSLSPLSWDEAYEKAYQTLPRMQASDKHALLQGIGWTQTKWFFDLKKWWHVGNTAPLSHLGVPSLNMGDAAGGFRTYWGELVGTVTCWPSMLALAATWDTASVHEFAIALGEEFAGKGANAILGPSIEVHRVARNGRNFEYLSGEDPHLGAKLTEAYVKGVQSQGVLAIAKHFVFNHQETHRSEYNTIVDDKTAWELYYPPFHAAVEAGVSGIMCSYNRIDGAYACSNAKQLKQVLKERMGFRGFVQSDWWATHETSLGKGLDQEMPGTGSVTWRELNGSGQQRVHNHTFFTLERLAKENQTAVDGAAVRVLAAIYRLKLDPSAKCSPPACQGFLMQNVTSAAHVALARRLARDSIVLLKNQDAVLPFSPAKVQTIAIIGIAAAAAAIDPNGQGQGSVRWNQGDYYSGGGSGHVVASPVVTPLDGLTRRAEAVGIRVLSSTDGNITAAVDAAKRADVAVIVAATTSGEAQDRANLQLDDEADALICAVAQNSVSTVVLIQAPGAVLMPWRHSINSILTMFLGGQETGSAWADVVFGDQAPSGRLPIAIPATEADTIPPSGALSLSYTEGMNTSYRNTEFVPAFPFGHGMTYTDFEYLPLTAERCLADQGSICVYAQVKNVGSTSARTVSQLYLEFPAEAGYPTPVLRSFLKTDLIAPGRTEMIVFSLSPRDLSYYNTSVSAWVQPGVAIANVGESVTDIRQSKTLHIGPSRRLAVPQSQESQDLLV